MQIERFQGFRDWVRFGGSRGGRIGFVLANVESDRLGSFFPIARRRDWVRFVERPLGRIGFVSSNGRGGRLGSFWKMTLLALAIPSLVGCGSSKEAPLIMATTWPSAERAQIERIVQGTSSDRAAIVWVTLAPGEDLASVVDRRGGVDILLGGPLASFVQLGRANRLDLSALLSVLRPEIDGGRSVGPTDGLGDPRVDPDSLRLAKSTLLAQGWSKGYEALVRSAAKGRPLVDGSEPSARSEPVALVRGGPNPTRAQQFLQSLESRGLASLDPSSSSNASMADDLLADLLGAALVDALDELRAAVAALDRFGHPAKAEAAFGERPPWPPASVAKLRADPNGEAMLETLLEQVAPDPDSRAWLLESWSRPRRQVDGQLLAELALANDGLLAREPRFRAWLRAEWTAWTRQLYRRVARVAGGYVPS